MADNRTWQAGKTVGGPSFCYARRDRYDAWRRRTLAFENLEPRLLLSAQPTISEFLADNKTGLTDSNGNRWDWIEICNVGDESVELGAHDTVAAWKLKCGKGSWSFPSGYTLAAGEFKVILAAGKSPSTAPTEVWADFALDKDGEDLGLVNPDGQTVCKYSPYPQQQPDISYGVGQTLSGTQILDSGTYYFSTPTPGALNSQNYWYHVEDTQFSVDRGFYTQAFQLAITTPTSGATIRYTLSGSEPSDNGRAKAVAMITRSSTTATVYCPRHGLAVGNSVRISGADQPAYNGLFKVARVLSADSFTVRVAGSPVTPATGVIKAVLDKLRTVTSISRSGTTAKVTTSAAHGYSAGNWVRIAGADPSAYDGVFKIVTVPNTTTFTYTVSGTPITPATGAITSDLDNTRSVTKISRSGTTAKATTSAAHGCSVGDWIQIAGADPSAYDGVFQIVQVPNTTTFTYTVSGSPTTPATGPITVQGTCLTYTGPITISKTSTVRAAAYRKGYDSTDVDTQTYIFLADVVTQSSKGAAPTGWPTATTINGQILNYGMDPDIVNSTTWGPNLQAALTAIPTISIVTAVPNLLNASSGIYVNASKEGEQWERPASVELINPDGTEGFQINAGIRIRGGTHGTAGINDKHAFRLFFNSQYGDSQLEYPLFGDDGVDSFDKLDLRCSSNMSWACEASTSDAIVREVFARDTQLAMGDPSTRSRFYHLYIDGQYWGLYQSEERPEASFAASYFGGSDTDYDVIKVSGSHTLEATDGNLTAWKALWNMARSGFAGDTTYYHAQGLDPITKLRDTAYPVYLDVDNLVDYMIGVLYTGDRDGPISATMNNKQINNWYGIWSHDGNSGFKFIRHDAEFTLSQGAIDRNGPYECGYSNFSYSNPQYLHEELMANADYRMRFADRAQKFLTHDGVLTAAAAISRLLSEAEQIGYSTTNGGPVVAESARWGDAKSTSPRTKNTWLSALNNEIDHFIPTRAATLLTQLQRTVLPSWRGGRPAPLYPSVTAPDFNQYGGAISSGFSLTMTGQGTIYYSLDGADPRLPGGAVRSGALNYSSPITLSASTHVLARSYSGGTWSALSEVLFQSDAAHGDVAPPPTSVGVIQKVESAGTQDVGTDLQPHKDAWDGAVLAAIWEQFQSRQRAAQKEASLTAALDAALAEFWQ